MSLGLSRHLARNPAVLAAVLAVYFGLGRIGPSSGVVASIGDAMWIPSGFALAAMMLLGRAIWPAVLAGAFLFYATASGQIASSLLMAVGNTAEAVMAALLIDRAAGSDRVFSRADSVFRFLAIAAFASTPVSATLGATAHVLMGGAPWTEFAYLWLTWWLSHLCGVLVVAPFLTLWIIEPFGRVTWLEMFEALVLGLLIGMVGLVVFFGWFPSGTEHYPLEFLVVPLLLWAAFRFGRRQTASATMLLTGTAVWGTMHGYGPFVRDSDPEALVLVQAYTVVMAITGLVLAAALAEHREARQQLHELATTDSLTGLANYRRLLEVLRVEIARSNRTKRPFSVLFVDMNGLKKINDRYGHLVGSRALARLAETLRRSVRNIDTPARYGGDEFAVVLAETGEAGGHVVLARVCERLAADLDTPAISVSGGVAVFPRDGDSPTMLLRAADRLLYLSKTKTLANRRVVPVDEPRTGTLF